MVLEQILRLFEESVFNNTSRESDRLVNTISKEFTENPTALKTFPILILQSTFQRKNLNPRKHFELLSRVLKEIFSIPEKNIESHKKKLLKDLIEYSEKFSKCVEKLYRQGIANFLSILKKHDISEVSSIESRLKVIAKRLIEDKDEKTRLAALRLAEKLNMKDEIIKVIKTDPKIDNRKSAIDCLKKDDQADALQELTRCLEDSPVIKLKTLQYFIKEEVTPDSDGIKNLFRIIVNDPNPVKSKAKELLSKILSKTSIIDLFKYMDLFPPASIENDLITAVSIVFSELYTAKTSELEPIFQELFTRLLNEKEKMDLCSLFVLRLSIGIYKRKNLNFSYWIDNLNLQEEFPKLVDFFLANTEEHKPHYYMKLQSILIITYIDLEENMSEILMKKYLKVCEEVPLLKFQYGSNSVEAGDELVEELNQKINSGPSIFAVNEEEVVATVIEIVREKFKDVERQYFLVLQELVDGVMKGIQDEEQENNVLRAPLQVKLEKNKKKIKEIDDELEMIKLEKTIKARTEAESKENDKTKLEHKNDLIIQSMFEKTYRSLLVISYILRHADLSETINPDYSSFAQNLFIPHLSSENLFISTLALRCLGYSCLLSKEQSHNFINYFLDRFTNRTKIIHLLSVIHIFDILLCRRLENSQKIENCIFHLWNSLRYEKDVFINQRDENPSLALNIITEGFAKLLLKNIIQAPANIFVFLFELFFDEKTHPDTFNIIQALFRNYIKMSEQKSIDLLKYYLIFIYINKKEQSFRLRSKSEDRIFKFCSLLDPKSKNSSYEKTENLHFMIFVFAFKLFEKNAKFFVKLLSSLNFEEFSQDEAKFIRIRLFKLKEANQGFLGHFEKMIKRLQLGTEVVEDITFREYDHRVDDIIAEAVKLEREVIVIPE